MVMDSAAVVAQIKDTSNTRGVVKTMLEPNPKRVFFRPPFGSGRE